MKNYIFLLSLLIILSLLSCNKNIPKTKIVTRGLQKKHRKDYSKINDIYKIVNSDKMSAFDRCLLKGFNNSPEIEYVLFKQDVCLGEFPGYYKLNRIDSLVDKAIKKIVQDSLYLADTWLDPNGEYQDLVGMKRVIVHCLELYSSPELDSLVKTFKY